MIDIKRDNHTKKLQDTFLTGIPSTGCMIPFFLVKAGRYLTYIFFTFAYYDWIHCCMKATSTVKALN
jgi:hypothetical protein